MGYELSGKYVVDGEILGFEIICNGEKKLLQTKDVYSLARVGQLKDCQIVKYKNTEYLRCKQLKIADLPTIRINNNSNSLRIVQRILKGDNLIGYVVEDSNGKRYNLSKNKVWSLSSNNQVTNATAYMYKDKKIIQGVVDKLDKLPKLKI